MTAPDWFINILIKLRLKDSEGKHLMREIATCEQRIQSINHELETLVSEIKSLENEFRLTKAEYDNLNGTARQTLGIRLINLIKARKRFKERNEILDMKLNEEHIFLHNLKLKINQINSRPAEDMKNIQDDKEVLINECTEAIQATKELERTIIPIDMEMEPDTCDIDSNNTTQEAYFEEEMKTFNTQTPKKHQVITY